MRNWQQGKQIEVEGVEVVVESAGGEPSLGLRKDLGPAASTD